VTRRSSGHRLVAVAIGLAIGMITVAAGQVEATTRTRSPGGVERNAVPLGAVEPTAALNEGSGRSGTSSAG
jgi:hypothetical protein